MVTVGRLLRFDSAPHLRLPLLSPILATLPPARIPSSRLPLSFPLQAKNSAEIVYNKMLQRLVLCIFLHAGIIHLVGNRESLSLTAAVASAAAGRLCCHRILYSV